MDFSIERFDIRNYLYICQYMCSCGLLKPIWELFFCRHCVQLRCSFCVFLEIEYCYCERCEESSTKTELSINHNKCGTCYICPCCSHQISKRIIYLSKKTEVDSQIEASQAEKNAKDKDLTFYLSCLRCRWNSREIRNSVIVVPKGSEFPIRTNPFENDVNEAKRYCQKLWREYEESVAIVDSNNDLKSKKKFRSYSDKTGLTVYSICKKLGFDADLLKQKHEKMIDSYKETISTSKFIATDQIEDLPDEIFNSELKLDQIPTIEQRLLEPCIQVDHVDDFRPIHQQLITKTSHRCRVCEHFVVKPDLFSSSIKFKIQLFASFHVPDIRVISFEKAIDNPKVASSIILQITNPTSYSMDIWLQEFYDIFDNNDVINALDENRKKVEEFAVSSTFNIISASQKYNEQFTHNYDIKFPLKMPIVIQPIVDPDTDFLNLISDDISYQDENESFIVDKKINEVTIKVPLIALENNEDDDDIRIQFNVYHSFINMMNATNQEDATKKEAKKTYHKISAFITCPKSLCLN